VFSLAHRAGFSQSSWEAYYNAYVQTAKELNGERALGQVFLFGEWRNDLRLTITAGEQSVWPQLKPGFIDEIYAYPSVTMANIAYGNKRYVFLVNSSEEPVEVRIDGFPAETIYARDAFTEQPLPVIEGSLTLAMPGLGVVGLCLSEGFVWINSPTEAKSAGPQIPVEIIAYGITPASVNVQLDGELLYNGDSLPTDLYLLTAELTGGQHQLAVMVSDASGNTHRASREFHVEHFRVVEPELRWGTTLRDNVEMALQLHIAASETQQLTLQLTAIIEGEPGPKYAVYSDNIAPERLLLETTRFPDGAYDMEIALTTTAGVTTSFTERVIFANWQTMTDALLPPQELGWFGIENRLKTVDRSQDWEFTTTDPMRFFGDGDRMRPQSQAPEYLTWRMDRLQRFTLTCYSRDSELGQKINIAISPNGEVWQSVDYIVQVADKTADGLLKLQLTGDVTVASAIQYIRISVTNDPATSDLELGEIRLLAKR
jgi:hypothetical protein